MVMEEIILYVGIDVSKHTLDGALTLDGETVLGRRQVANTPAGYEQLHSWVGKYVQRVHALAVHYCLEATGIYSEGVAQYLAEQENVRVSVMNPMQVKAFGTSLLLRTKTDKVDAELLARYGAKVQPAPTVQLPEELKILRSLVRHLEHLIQRQAQEQGHLESATYPTVRRSIKKSIAHYAQQITRMHRQIADHLDQHPHLKNQVDLLQTIPGIGPQTAQRLLCELHPARQQGRRSTKAQVAHAGLAPREKQSGSSIRGKPGICRVGNTRLRTGLYFPTMSAIRHNPVIGSFYQRLIDNGKPPMVALVASMRKLLVIAIGVLNNQMPFDPNWKPKPFSVPLA
jgi:transposase